MAVFLDTGILVAEANIDDSLHSNAVEILSQINSGIYGNWICTSDYVFDEALTLMYIRTGNIALSKGLAKRLLSLDGLNLLRVDEGLFKESTSRYLAQSGKLSFTDCTTVELMKQNEITHLATFDSGFNSIPSINLVPLPHSK